VSISISGINRFFGSAKSGISSFSYFKNTKDINFIKKLITKSRTIVHSKFSTNRRHSIMNAGRRREVGGRSGYKRKMRFGLMKAGIYGYREKFRERTTSPVIFGNSKTRETATWTVETKNRTVETK
jgi:hypothetical protein